MWVLKKNISLLNNMTLGIVIIFPLIFIFRSASINIGTIVLSLIVCLLLILKKINIKILFKSIILKYLFFFLIFIILNSIYHQQSFLLVLKSFGNLRYLLLTIAVFYILENTNENWKKNLIYFNVFLITLISLDVIYQYFFYKNIFGFEPGMCPTGISNGCYRFSGVFKDEWIAGTYLSQIGLLFIILLFSIRFNSKKKNIFLIGYVTALFITIILTGERNGALIFILCIFLFLILIRDFKKLIMISIFLVSSLFFLGIFSKSIETRFANPIKSINQIKFSQFYYTIKDSPWGRHYNAAIELFLEKPFLGHGPKSFRNICKKTSIETKLIENESVFRACSTHPHNYFLEFLSENGILGGLFYLGFIFIIIFQIINLDKRNNYKYYLVVAIGSLILAILFPFKPSGSFFTTFNASIFFYILGFYLHFSFKKIG